MATASNWISNQRGRGRVRRSVRFYSSWSKCEDGFGRPIETFGLRIDDGHEHVVVSMSREEAEVLAAALQKRLDCCESA